MKREMSLVKTFYIKMCFKYIYIKYLYKALKYKSKCSKNDKYDFVLYLLITRLIILGIKSEWKYTRWSCYSTIILIKIMVEQGISTMTRSKLN